ARPLRANVAGHAVLAARRRGGAARAPGALAPRPRALGLPGDLDAAAGARPAVRRLRPPRALRRQHVLLRRRRGRPDGPEAGQLPGHDGGLPLAAAQPPRAAAAPGLLGLAAPKRAVGHAQRPAPGPG